MEVTQTHSQHFMNTTDHWNQKYLQRVTKVGMAKMSVKSGTPTHW